MFKFSIHINTGNHLASVGLDRFLRVYNTSKSNTGIKDPVPGNRSINIGSKLMCAAYLKNRLNCCLLADNTAKKPKGPKKIKNRGDTEDDDTLISDVNFDSEEEEDDDDEDDEGNSSDGEEGSAENDEMVIDDDDEDDGDDEDDNSEDDDEDDEDEEKDDDSDGEGDGDNDGSDVGDDSSESNDDGDDSDADRKGPGKGRYSSRKERVAHVAKVAQSKIKATSSNSNGSKKRKL